MVYQLFKIWAKLAFSLYFRRIFISGTENIPKKASVLILVNHPSSFMEPCVIAAFQHRNLHFLVRGDMFEKKWLLPILKSTNQIPIFRLKDGFGKLRNSKNTFDQSYKVLVDKHTLMMFPEASSEMVKYLRPLQKGAARLALGAFEDKNMEELFVIPTGIHYFNAIKSRNDVILKFGKAFSMRTWLDNNTATEDKINALTAIFQNEMDKVVISIDPNRPEQIYNDAYTLAENDHLKYTNSGILKSESGYVFYNKIVGALNQLSESSFADLEKKISSFKGTHNNVKSVDSCITMGIIDKLKIMLSLVTAFIIGLPGFYLYAPSLIFSILFAKKIIKHNTFFAPVRIAINMGTHLINSILLILFRPAYLNFFETLIIFIFLQLSLYSFAIFIDYVRYARHLFSFSILKQKSSMQILRNEIIGRIEEEPKNR